MDGRCQHFSFRVPISICIISIPHGPQRKDGDAHTKPKLTREQWWPEGSFCGGLKFSKSKFNILSG